MTEEANFEMGVVAAICLQCQRRDESHCVLEHCHEIGLAEEAFTQEIPRDIYRAVLQVERECPDGFDATLIVERYRKNIAGDKTKKGNAHENFNRMLDACPTSAYGESYADRVFSAWRKREIARYAREVVGRCEGSAEMESWQNLLWDFESRLQKLDARLVPPPDTSDLVVRTAERLQRFVASGWAAEGGLSTGFAGLDGLLHGLKPGMAILAARPSVGKTALAMNIATCVATGRMCDGRKMTVGDGARHGVLVVSLEMSEDDLMRRIMLSRAGIDVKRAGEGLLARDEREASSKRLEAVRRELCDGRNFPLRIVAPNSREVSEICQLVRREIRRSKNKGRTPIELVVVDYLQLMNCREMRASSRPYEVGAVSAAMKALSMQLGLPVLVLSQLSRQAEQRGDKDEKPKLSDLRDSGAIEQDADAVILLWRAAMVEHLKATDRRDEAEARVVKNRNGEIGVVKLSFDGSHTQFVDFGCENEGAVRERPEPEPDLSAEAALNCF